MAEINLESPFNSLHGRLGKNAQVIYRQKNYRLPKGTAASKGPLEAYIVQNPRNRKLSPTTPAEQAAIDRFRQACLQAKQQLQNPETRAYWEERFNKQLTNPEPAYNGNHRSGKQRIFTNLHLFVRTVILRQLTQDAKNNNQSTAR